MVRSCSGVSRAASVVVLLACVACTVQSGDGGSGQLSQDDLILESAMANMPPAGVELPQPDSEGAQATLQYCAACHAAPSPTSHSATDWPAVLRRMWVRTERVADEFAVPLPDASARLVISEYMLDNALRVTEGELPDFLGRSEFVTTCSRCHELPDPRQHTPQDWPTTVIRMREHMVELLGDSPTQAQVQDIITFLQGVSE